MDLSLEVTQGAAMNLFRNLYFILKKVADIHADISSYTSCVCPFLLMYIIFFFLVCRNVQIELSFRIWGDEQNERSP